MDYASAAQARDVAMVQVAQGADRAHPDWCAGAYVYLCTYAETHAEPFLAEDVRLAFIRGGNVPPHDNRAWGPVFSRAAREGVIQRVGYGPARTGHCRPMPQWERGDAL